MKEVDNLDIIWTRASRGSTLPFVLSIKITHLNTLKQGRFQMFDLLNAPFTLPVPGRTIYRSFSHFGMERNYAFFLFFNNKCKKKKKKKNYSKFG